MPDEIAHHAIAMPFGMMLNGMADIAQTIARAGLFNAQHHAFIGHVDPLEASGGDGFDVDAIIAALVAHREVEIAGLGAVECMADLVPSAVIARTDDSLNSGAVALLFRASGKIVPEA